MPGKFIKISKAILFAAIFSGSALSTQNLKLINFDSIIKIKTQLYDSKILLEGNAYTYNKSENNFSNKFSKDTKIKTLYPFLLTKGSILNCPDNFKLEAVDDLLVWVSKKKDSFNQKEGLLLISYKEYLCYCDSLKLKNNLILPIYLSNNDLLQEILKTLKITHKKNFKIHLQNNPISIIIIDDIYEPTAEQPKIKIKTQLYDSKILLEGKAFLYETISKKKSSVICKDTEIKIGEPFFLPKGSILICQSDFKLNAISDLLIWVSKKKDESTHVEGLFMIPYYKYDDFYEFCKGDISLFKKHLVSENTPLKNNHYSLKTAGKIQLYSDNINLLTMTIVHDIYEPLSVTQAIALPTDILQE